MRNLRSLTKRLAAVGAAAVMGLGLAVTVSSPASADDWNTSLKPDSWHVTYCFSSNFNSRPGFRDAAHYAMYNLERQTNFTRAFTSCNTSTDIIFRVNTTSNWRGMYRCVTSSSGRCWHSSIWLNPNHLANKLNRRKTACHEVGHYGRLMHHRAPYSDCMVSGHVTETRNRIYNDHHRWHLNHSI